MTPEKPLKETSAATLTTLRFLAAPPGADDVYPFADIEEDEEESEVVLLDF